MHLGGRISALRLSLAQGIRAEASQRRSRRPRRETPRDARGADAVDSDDGATSSTASTALATAALDAALSSMPETVRPSRAEADVWREEVEPWRQALAAQQQTMMAQQQALIDLMATSQQVAADRHARLMATLDAHARDAAARHERSSQLLAQAMQIMSTLAAANTGRQGLHSGAGAAPPAAASTVGRMATALGAAPPAGPLAINPANAASYWPPNPREPPRAPMTFHEPHSHGPPYVDLSLQQPRGGPAPRHPF